MLEYHFGTFGVPFWYFQSTILVLFSSVILTLFPHFINHFAVVTLYEVQFGQVFLNSVERHFGYMEFVHYTLVRLATAVHTTLDRPVAVEPQQRFLGPVEPLVVLYFVSYKYHIKIKNPDLRGLPPPPVKVVCLYIVSRWQPLYTIYVKTKPPSRRA